MTKAISAKGVMVDFDLLKIKQQIAGATPAQPTTVQARQQFVDTRMKRQQRQVARANRTAVQTAGEVVVEPKIADTDE